MVERTQPNIPRKVLEMIVIPTIESRISLASDLAHRVGGKIIVDPVGDGTERSATDNHVRAMLSADRSSGWVVVMEDDAVPIPDFNNILNNQLQKAPYRDCIISLYLGQQRPPRIQTTIERTILGAPDDMSWLQSRFLYWGVAVCVPSHLIDSMAGYSLTSHRPWDTGVGSWAYLNSVPVMYTWPSIVDHLDEETTINHEDGMGREQGRKAWKVGKPIPNGSVSMLK